MMAGLSRYLCLVVAVIILNGCMSPLAQPAKDCPGVNSVEEALSKLISRWQNAVTLKAVGRVYVYSGAGDSQHNSAVKIWIDPPMQMYSQTDIFFDPKGVVVGSNENEFWMITKPRQSRSYRWGIWTEQDPKKTVLTSPLVMLEYLGIVFVDSDNPWLLAKDELYDILVEFNERGAITKKIYLSKCDALVRIIEYFDPGSGAVVERLEFDDYKKVTDDFIMPAAIKISGGGLPGAEGFVKIHLESIKENELNDKQRSIMFDRPEPTGFGTVYKIVGDEEIEQLVSGQMEVE